MSTKPQAFPIEAQRQGVEALHGGRPLSSSLLREIHGVLLEGARGAAKSPGAYRTKLVHFGRRGSPMSEASYIPPPPLDVPRLMDDLESYIQDARRHRPLIRAGIAHAQFEMIHPFEDGNGRVGRMLVGLVLCEAGMLREPMLYLSGYLNEHRSQYIEHLSAISRDGDWNSWLDFFLRGIASSGATATATAEEIMHIRRRDENVVAREVRSQYAHAMMTMILRTPYVTLQSVVHWVKCSKPTAASLLRELTELGILTDLGKVGRHRFYRYDAMWLALRGDFTPGHKPPVDETISAE